MMWTLFIAASWGQDCTVEALAEQVALGEAAFIGRDKPGVAAAAENSEELLSCQTQAISPELAARFHGLQALAAFLLGDVESMDAWFTAALHADSGYDFPAETLPKGNPARKAFDDAGGSLTRTASIEAPDGFVVFIDGEQTLERPIERPVVYQAGSSDLFISTSTVLHPDFPTPELIVQVGPGELPEAPRARRSAAPWFVVAGTAAVASGAMYVASGRAEQNFYEAGSVSDATTLQRRTNGMSVGAGAALGVAAGAAIGGVVILTF